MAPELLERLFVARERTLDAVMQRIGAAADSQTRNHTLLVGPRGAGKTHIVALAHHRTQQLRADGARLQVSWLPEDPWTLVSYRHLLATVLDRLDPPGREPGPRSEPELEAALRELAEERGPVVVFVENLDQILSALGEAGQQRLRHLLQADRSLLLVATSTRLDRALSDQNRPFYAFFTTTRLEPFGVDDAAEMLKAIAVECGDPDVAGYLDSAEGRSRLRTVTHLAGGQPRMWAALASAISVEGLDDLVDLLLTRFDDLTPYYQEQLGRLSGQQRVVVAELAELDRPVNVAELAHRVETDPRSLAKTLSELVDRGWATPTKSPLAALLDRRRTYYELAEPLARLSFQIKESRGEPLRLVVDFLKHWFDPDQLDTARLDLAERHLELARSGQETDATLAVTRRLQDLPATRAPALALLDEVDTGLELLALGDPEPLLRLPVPVRMAVEERLQDGRAGKTRWDVHQAAMAEMGFVRHPAMTAWIQRTESWIPRVDDLGAGRIQILLSEWLARSWRFDEADAVLDSIVGVDDRDMRTVRAQVALAHFHAGRPTETIRRLEHEIEKAVADDNVSDRGDLRVLRANLAAAYESVGRSDEALLLEEQVVSDYRSDPDGDPRSRLRAHANLAGSYMKAGRHDDAVELQGSVVADLDELFDAWHPDAIGARDGLAVALASAGRIDDAIRITEQMLATCVGPTTSSQLLALLNARMNLAEYRVQSGQVERGLAELSSVLIGRQDLLGSGHPSTLGAMRRLASATWLNGDSSSALELWTETLSGWSAIGAVDQPDARKCALDLSRAYRHLKRDDDAEALEAELSHRRFGQQTP